MTFKKIEIQGFKSFADRTVIELRPGITAVIGPNGSGKSNIVDAIRWVLGEQSMKSLRGQKSQDIIFSGTQIRRSLGFAEVALYIDNKSRKLKIEYDEVVVKRRLYRDGGSIYYLNNNECRLKTIQEMFMDTGIGKDGYSIIGQGKIDEILSHKSDERRIIFEEAAGIVKYRFRKEESEKKIEKTKLNLQRVNDIISEIELNIDNLSDQSEKAKSYLNLRDELKKLEIINFALNLEKFKEEENKINANKDEISVTYNDEIENLNLKEKDINDYKDRIDEIVLEIEKIQNLDFETKEKINKILADIELNKERIENYNINKDRFQEEKESAEEKILELEKDKNIQSERILKYDTDAESFKLELEEKEKELNKLKSNLSELELNKTKKKEEISDLVDKRYEVENVKLNLLMQIENINEVLKQKDSEERNIISDLDSLRIEQQEKASENINLVKSKEDLESRVNNLKEELNIKFEKEEVIKEKYQNIQTELVLKKSRIELLDNLEKDKEGFNFAIKKLIEENQKRTHYGNLVDSVLANVINLKEEYQVAIEMALGYSLQNIIVEKEEDAKELINYLKANKYGRASFLPMNVIKGNKIDLKHINANINGIRGVAADLVDYPNKYENIINYLLGRIIIVDNNDTAIQLARMTKYKYKIITLDGDIINPSGVMTGGSLNKTSGKILGRKNEIDKLKNDLIKLEKELENISIEKDRIQKEREVTSGDYERFNNQMQELISQNEIYFQEDNILKREIEKLQNSLNNLREFKEEQRANRKNLEEEKSKVEDDINNISSQIENLEKEVDSEEDINPDDVEKVDDLNFDVSNLKISLLSFDESKNSVQEVLNLILEQLEDNNNIKEDRERKIEENSENITRSEENLKNLYSEIENIQSTESDFSQEVEELRKEREEKNVKLRDLENEIKSINENLNHIKEQISKYILNLDRLEMQKDSLIIYMWEEYELTPNSSVLQENIEEQKEKYEDFSENSKNIKRLKREIKEIGSVNIDAIEEYRKTKERYDFLIDQKEDLETTINSLKEIIVEMQKVMKEQFDVSFKQINIHFSNIFKELFGGGKAEIILEDESDSLQSGIDIRVEPPGKKLQTMSLLSGGERALTAIAVLFAILSINPSPFCVLDEIESALDEANVARYARFLRNYSKKTQFLMITHRKGTMEVADNIYGVTMQESGISNIVSMSLKAAQKTGKN